MQHTGRAENLALVENNVYCAECGSTTATEDDGNFKEQVENLHSELWGLTDEEPKLEDKIFDNLKKIDI